MGKSRPPMGYADGDDGPAEGMATGKLEIDSPTGQVDLDNLAGGGRNASLSSHPPRRLSCA